MTKSCILFSFLCLICIGCGDSKELANKAGEKVGGTMTKFVKGVGEGIDKESEVKLSLNESLKEVGLSHTVAISQGEGISVYFISKQKQTLNLMAKAFDEKEREIGRAKVPVSFDVEDAKYVQFDFPKELNQQRVVNYTVEHLK